jgi:hypothetical protein
MISLFSRNGVCTPETAPIGKNCYLTKAAEEWLAYANNNILRNTGNCVGMSVTSLEYWKGLSSLPQGTANTFQLSPNGDILKSIAIESVKQRTVEISKLIDTNLKQTPGDIVNLLRSYLANKVPVAVGIWYSLSDTIGDPNAKAHMIVPFKLTDEGGNKYRVYVYDMNKQNSLTNAATDASYYIEIDTSTNSWWYQMAPDYKGQSELWKGSVSSKANRIAVLPIDLFLVNNYVPVFASNGTTQQVQALQSTTRLEEIILTGDSKPLFVDSQGRRFGYVGAAFTEEIPGAYVEAPLALEQSSVIYHVPSPYRLELYANGMGTVDITKFGAGHVVDISGIIPGTAPAIVTTAADGSIATFQPAVTQAISVSLGLTQDANGNSEALQVKNVSVQAGTTFNLSEGQTLSLSGAKAGTYDLEVNRITSSGVVTFTASSIPIQQGERHDVSYGSWTPGQGTMPLEVHNPDGSTDEITLQNGQVVLKKVYLPLMVR